MDDEREGVINIKNTQRSITVSTARLKANAQKMLNALGYGDFDLGIWLTTDATIRRYNKDYRGKDSATDILSFSYHDQLQPGDDIIVKEPEDKNLGDLIISIPYVKNDAAKWGQTFTQRLDVLLAHGISHLLNYDHETDEEYVQMQKVEKRLLKSIQ